MTTGDNENSTTQVLREFTQEKMNKYYEFISLCRCYSHKNKAHFIQA